MATKVDKDVVLRLIGSQVRGFVSAYTILVESLKEVFQDEVLKNDIVPNICMEAVNPREIAQLICASIASVGKPLTSEAIEELIDAHIEDMFAPLHTIMVRFAEEADVDKILQGMISDVHVALRDALEETEDTEPEEVN